MIYDVKGTLIKRFLAHRQRDLEREQYENMLLLCRDKRKGELVRIPINDLSPCLHVEAPTCSWRNYCREKQMPYQNSVKRLLYSYALVSEPEDSPFLLEDWRIDSTVVKYLWTLEEEKKHIMQHLRFYSNALHKAVDMNACENIIREFLVAQCSDASRKNLWFCWHCHSEESKDVHLFSCGTCRVATYCSQRCQKKDWPLHKLKCKSFLAADPAVMVTFGKQ